MSDGYLNFDTKINEQGFNEGISKLNNLAKSGVSVAGKALAGITAAVGASAAAMVKSSLDVVASMEQNIGGIETLFKDSADTVIENANRAYKSAGMSANDYMSTVTSFSASLLQSLGGDTKKAAEVADMAITDMSDNANKMGTSMELIQNAYQGFAKHNYTMLDNLKLGYGGTKTEMERLLADAQKLTGIKYDISNLSDVYNAIHVIQEQLGITGTTAAEAMTTIEGSANAAKAAWENFLAGTISAEDMVDTFGIAADNVITNLGQIIPRLGTTTLEVVGLIADKIGETIPAAQGMTDAIGSIVDKLQGMSTDELMNLGKIALTIAGAVPTLSLFSSGLGTVSTAVQGLNGITDGVLSGLGNLPKTFQNIKSSASSWAKSLGNLGSALTLPFQDLAPTVKDVSGKILDAMSNVWNGSPGSKLVSSIGDLVAKIGSGFGKIGPAISAKFPGITSKLSALSTNIGKFGSKVLGQFSTLGTKISTYGGIIGEAFTPILQKAASFAPAFLRCMNIAGGLGIVAVGLGLLYNQFGTEIDNILLMMQTKGPQVIGDFCSGITAALPNLIAQGTLVLNNLMIAITANIPAVISGGVSIITGLISGIASQMPMLIPTAIEMILTLVTSLLSNVGQIVDAGINLLEGLADGVLNAIPILVASAPTIIGNLANAIITNLPKILQAGIQIITKLASGLIQAVPSLISKIPSIISQIKNSFTSINWGSVGKNIIQGIASGVSAAAGALVEAAANAAEDALEWVKNKLGIHSPSRVFRDQVGKMMALGMGIGFEKNIPVKAMNKGLQTAVNSLKKDVVIATSARTNQSVGSIKNHPEFNLIGKTNWDEWERRQRRINKERDSRPIFLGTKRIDQPLPKGAVPQV